MLSRAKRTTHIVTSGCTTEDVGPGSYAVLETSKQQKHQGPSAAFAWAGKRCTVPSAAQAAAEDLASTALDQAAGSIRPWANNNATSSFSSAIQRFLFNKEAAAKPGPGAYQTTPSWAQNAPSWQTQGSKQSPAYTPSTALIGCPVRVFDPSAVAAAAAAKALSTHADLLLSTPPSIPARHQSYGYEPGPDGSLVMQPPPALTTPTSSAGKSPAAASSSSRAKSLARPSTVQHARKAPHAGAGGREPGRQLVQQLAAAQEAGQQLQGARGSFRFRCAAGGKLVLSKGIDATGSAAFASKSARLHQQEPDPETLTPGPGAYHSRPNSAPVGLSSAAAGGSCLPVSRARTQQPLFARAAGRSAALSMGPGWSLPPSKHTAPGPGTYNLRPAATGGLADRATHGARGSMRQGMGVRASSIPAAGAAAAGEQGGAELAAGAAAAAAGFGCTSRRFGDNSTASPGPGKYTTDQLLSMSAEAAKRAAAASKRGAFGTAASSCSFSAIDTCFGYGGSSAGAAPGPGCYDVRAGLSDRAATAAGRPSPGFVSSCERFTAAAAPIAAPDYASFDGSTMKGDQARLGPGAYIKLDEWGRGGSSSSWREGYRSAPFGSESSRPAVAAAAAGQVPGPGEYASVDVSKVFQPLSMPGKSGFCTTSQRFKLKAATPETVGPGTYSRQSSLVKPSFNVTLDQC